MKDLYKPHGWWYGRYWVIDGDTMRWFSCPLDAFMEIGFID